MQTVCTTALFIATASVVPTVIVTVVERVVSRGKRGGGGSATGAGLSDLAVHEQQGQVPRQRRLEGRGYAPSSALERCPASPSVAAALDALRNNRGLQDVVTATSMDVAPPACINEPSVPTAALNTTSHVLTTMSSVGTLGLALNLAASWRHATTPTVKSASAPTPLLCIVLLDAASEVALASDPKLLAATKAAWPDGNARCPPCLVRDAVSYALEAEGGGRTAHKQGEPEAMALRSARFDAAQMAKWRAVTASLESNISMTFLDADMSVLGDFRPVLRNAVAAGDFRTVLRNTADRDTAASGSASGACYDYAAWRWNVGFLHFPAWGARRTLPLLRAFLSHMAVAPAGTWDQDEWISFSQRFSQFGSSRRSGRLVARPTSAPPRKAITIEELFRPGDGYLHAATPEGPMHPLGAPGGLGHIYHPTVGFGWSAKGGAHALKEYMLREHGAWFVPDPLEYANNATESASSRQVPPSTHGLRNSNTSLSDDGLQMLGLINLALVAGEQAAHGGHVQAELMPLFPPLYEQMETAALLGLALALQSYAVATMRGKPQAPVRVALPLSRCSPGSGPMRALPFCRGACLPLGLGLHEDIPGMGAVLPSGMHVSLLQGVQVPGWQSGTGAAFSYSSWQQMRNSPTAAAQAGQGLGEDGDTLRVRVVEGTGVVNTGRRAEAMDAPSMLRDALVVDIEARAAAGNGGDAVGGAAARSLGNAGGLDDAMLAYAAMRASSVATMAEHRGLPRGAKESGQSSSRVCVCKLDFIGRDDAGGSASAGIGHRAQLAEGPVLRTLADALAGAHAPVLVTGAAHWFCGFEAGSEEDSAWHEMLLRVRLTHFHRSC